MSCTGNCDECAFKEGSEANQEPYNMVQSQLCVFGGLPFYCHHGMDWRASNRRAQADTLITEGKMKICNGWKLGVKKLAAKGWFKQNVMAKKLRAMQSLVALHKLNQGNEISNSERQEIFKTIHTNLNWFVNQGAKNVKE